MRIAIVCAVVLVTACASSSEAEPKACASSEECPRSAPCCAVHGQGYACAAESPGLYVCLCKSTAACSAGTCCRALPFGSSLSGCQDEGDAAACH